MEAFNVKVKERRKNKRAALAERVLLPHMPVEFDDVFSQERHFIEQFVAERFDHYYQAEITHFLPYFLSTKTGDTHTAVVGFQSAGSVKPLFLEQYLNASIEDEVSRLSGLTVERNRIAEVGNLTSIHRGTSQLLFVLIIAILHEAGFEWTVFTATKHVQQLLSRLNLVVINVCEADPDKLINGKQSWGSYYDDKPNVIIGNLTNAIAQLRAHKVIGFMLENYQDTITNIAQKITR